jgi:ferredoxin
LNKIKRKIIKIDENKCTGCGLCITGCPEQALQLVETPQGPKARLVKEFYCDGLGACIGSCPEGAIKIIEQEVEPYNEEATIARIQDVAPEMLTTHIKHMQEHANELPEHHSHQMPKGFNSCPSVKEMHWEEKPASKTKKIKIQSELRQWPVQLHLVNPSAPYFKNIDILLVADCVPFTYANFHQNFLKGNTIAIACPKLDDAEAYIDKIADIIQIATPKSIKIVNMEVPCCFGLISIVNQAMAKAKKKVPVEQVTISIKGEIKH